MKTQLVLKQIFEQAKDGDGVFFQANGIKKYPIGIATEGKWTHCGTVWLIERNDKEVSFNFSEQTFSGGKFDRVKIQLIEGFYFASGNHRFVDSDDLLLKIIPAITDEQYKTGLSDALGQVGKKYGYLSFIFGLSLLEKILPKRLKNKINHLLEKWERVCSTHVAIQWSKMGLITYKSEMFFSPTDLANIEYVN